MRRSLLTLILIFVLAFLCACSCGDVGNGIVQVLSEHLDVASDTDISQSDTTVISESDISPSDISESTTLETTTTTEATTTTTTTTATDPATDGLSRDERNAPGVYSADYKEDYYIVVHTGSQSVAVYGKDSDGYYTKLVKCFTCSTGKSGHDTRTGLYKIRRRYRWRLLVGNVYGQYSSGFSDSYLFHSVPYNKQSVDTLDNEEYDKLGSPASHGCVRLCVRDSKWIYDNCPLGTQVFVTNTSGPEGEGVPTRNTDSAYNGWDPSDKWAKHNPYFYSPSTAATTTTTVSSQTETTTSTEETTTTTSATETTTTEATTTVTEATTTTTTTTVPSDEGEATE